MCVWISGTSLLYLWMGSTRPLEISAWHSPGSRWLGWVSAFPQLPLCPFPLWLFCIGQQGTPVRPGQSSPGQSRRPAPICPPPPGEETGREQDSHWSRGWSLGCCFHFGFLLPVRPGIFNDSEMKLLHRCEMTASCRRQTNYLQTQPTTPTQPHKGSQPASLG